METDSPPIERLTTALRTSNESRIALGLEPVIWDGEWSAEGEPLVYLASVKAAEAKAKEKPKDAE